MTELRAHNFSVSLDGFGAGPAQSEQDPLGIGGELLHEWIFVDDATETDRRFRARGDDGIGATITGRNMVGPGGRGRTRSGAAEKGPPSPHHSQARGGPLRDGPVGCRSTTTCSC